MSGFAPSDWSIGGEAASRRPVPAGPPGMRDSWISSLGFVRLCILGSLLDLALDGEGGELAIWVNGRTADYERFNAAGETTVVVRCHAGDEKTAVVSSDIWVAVRRWARRPDHNCLFVFCSNCDLYPTAVTIVGNRLDRIHDGSAGDEDIHVARLLGLEVDSALLRNLRVHVRADPSGNLANHTLKRVGPLVASTGDLEVPALKRLLASCTGEEGAPRVISFAEVDAALSTERDLGAPTGAHPIEGPANYRARVLAAIPGTPASVVRGCLFDHG